MPAAAVLSTGRVKDFYACREDVLKFLMILSWRISSIKVKVWASQGLPHDPENGVLTTRVSGTLADRIALFINRE
jgi:hypothetical protein